MSGGRTYPRTVDQIYDDFCKRRHALQRALTIGEDRGSGRASVGRLAAG
jgi:hypothetical protein